MNIADPIFWSRFQLQRGSSMGVIAYTVMTWNIAIDGSLYVACCSGLGSIAIVQSIDGPSVDRNRLFAMATESSPVQSTVQEMVCKLCNRKVAADAGRVHGRSFRCQSCATIERAMHRNLGSTAELGTWSNEDCHAFFQKLHEERGDKSSLQWTTIRAVLLRKMTERKISSFAATTTITPLPLSVLLVQGWEKEVVERFPKEHSDTYGCDVYKVPIQKLSWKDVFQTIEEKILEQEKEATKRRSGKKGKDDDMDVPLSKVPKDQERDDKSDKKQQQELRKIATHNAKMAGTAAKALGPLSTAEAALTKLLSKAEGKEGIDASAASLCREKLVSVTAWGQHCRDAVNAQEKNKALPAHEAAERLSELPFDSSDLKVLMKQITEGQKALKSSLPKKAATPKQPEAAGTEGDAEPKPKRRRGKSAA